MRAARIAAKAVARLLAGTLIVTTVSYLLARSALGNPLAGLGAAGSLPATAAEQLRRIYGLDEPLPVGLASFIAGVLRLDTGYSLVYAAPAYPLAAESLAYTLLALLPGALGGLALFALVYLAAGEAGLRILRPAAFIPGFIYAVAASLVAWYTGFYSTLPSLEPQKLVVYSLVACLVVAPRLSHVMLEVVEGGEARLYEQRYAAIGAPRLRSRLALMRIYLAPLASYLLASTTLLLEHSVFIEPILGYPGAGYLLYTAVSRGDPVLAATLFTLLGSVSYTLIALGEALEPILDPRLWSIEAP